jgi:transposase
VSRQRRYPSDLTDAQWALIELLLPAPNTGGPPEKHPRRDIVDAILYAVRTGCARRQLPFDFPPWQLLAHSRCDLDAEEADVLHEDAVRHRPHTRTSGRSGWRRAWSWSG